MQQNRLQLHVNGLNQPGPDSRRRCSAPERLRAPTITKPFLFPKFALRLCRDLGL
jgi:hypothetical protein